MTYLLTNRFTRIFPGPYDVRASQDGADNSFEIYCLQSELTITALYYWEEEDWAFRNAMGIATALNAVFHQGLALPEGLEQLTDLLAECPAPFKIRRGDCEGRGGHWQIYSVKTDENIVEAYGGLMDMAELAIAYTIRNALTYCDMDPRKKRVPLSTPVTDEEMDAICF